MVESVMVFALMMTLAGEPVGVPQTFADIEKCRDLGRYLEAREAQVSQHRFAWKCEATLFNK